MSIAAVRSYFAQFGMENQVLEFDVSSATVELAAQAVGVIPARIAKSLSFKVDGKAILIITAGDAKVDNVKFKSFFHTKAKMLTPDEVVELVGHAIGGVCPFGIKEGVDVYLDVSLRRFDTVFPAAGSGSSAIQLTCDQLEQYACGFRGWGDFCKGWQETP
ncbi:MAG: YbaK/EbsC family protein [Clostridiales bacterium]|uniref:YbaK/EbsC family protein n=1 Tax=Evtepia sp. TaxID=2773933 RepID=UPI0029855A52|nr:YbaK/EbsC family protein [Evtepia sp.]MDD7289679.1 YbaK/EbsC family protein [Clostridiales bacterium]MDY3992513.1 YbaK/EbsC family protein [Evtepia sp.]MDY4430107.1 YbaK/EbsC family protein [Evtepia sp.]